MLFAGVKTTDAQGLTDISLGIPIYCQRRSAGNRSDCNTLRVTNKQRVASRGVEKTGLTSAQIEGVEKIYREAERKENYPDRIYRKVRERPLLIVHLLAIGNEREDLSGQKPTVAWSISFPRTAMEEMRVEYVVNTTWWKENYRDELDDEEMAGDDV